MRDLTGPRRRSGRALLLAVPALVAACGSASTTTTTVTVLDGGSAEPATVTVTAPAPATTAASGAGSATTTSASDTVDVVDAGFSQRDKELGIGVLLRNHSAREARSVDVAVNIVDADDDVLKTETGSLNLIPAGGTAAVGIDSFLDAPTRPKTLEITVITGSFEGSGTALPAIRRVQVRDDQFAGSTVTGELRNTTSLTVSRIQQIGVVLLGADGKVIGGGYTFPGADIPPGGRVAFAASNGVSVTPRAQIRRAIVTIDGAF